MAPLTLFWPPPAQQPVNMKKTLLKKKKMLLIINWDASVFSLSGIWAMHWLSKLSGANVFASSDSHSAPVSSATLTFFTQNTQTAELLLVT